MSRSIAARLSRTLLVVVLFALLACTLGSTIAPPKFSGYDWRR